MEKDCRQGRRSSKARAQRGAACPTASGLTSQLPRRRNLGMQCTAAGHLGTSALQEKADE